MPHCRLALPSGELLKTLIGHTELIDTVTFDPDGQTLASGSYDQTIKLWNVQTGKLLQSLSLHSGPVRSVAFSSDKRYLASGGDDKAIKIWEKK